MNSINKFLCKITPTHNYDYFDQFSQLQTKKLHIFQFIARKAFGWYAETHLSNVVKRGYTVTLNDQFQTTPAKQQRLLKLIVAHRLFSPSKSYMELPTYHLSDGSTVNISIRYSITTPPSIIGAISSIDFKL